MLEIKSPPLNSKGMAVFEIIPILVIFVILINFTLGFFGAIHSGILNSIAARNYAFETFENRANLNYFRDVPMADTSILQEGFSRWGYRFHGIVGEGARSDIWVPTKRSIKFSELTPSQSDSEQTHIQQVRQIATDKRVSEVTNIDKDSFTKIWVRTVYGICLNPKCGGD